MGVSRQIADGIFRLATAVKLWYTIEKQEVRHEHRVDPFASFTRYSRIPHTSFNTLLRLNPRPISDSQLNALLHLHLCPIYLLVLEGSYSLRLRYLILRGASRLDAFSVYPIPTWLLCHGLASQQIHQRSVHPGPLVLRTAPLKYLPPTPDRDRTVSRRSEPSSRTALMGEQPNPWDRLQPQDAMSRHRGAKPLRRCELLGVISLLSPG